MHQTRCKLTSVWTQAQWALSLLNRAFYNICLITAKKKYWFFQKYSVLHSLPAVLPQAVLSALVQYTWVNYRTPTPLHVIEMRRGGDVLLYWHNFYPRVTTLLLQIYSTEHCHLTPAGSSGDSQEKKPKKMNAATTYEYW